MSATLLTQGAVVIANGQENGMMYSRRRRNALADIFHDVDAGLVSELCQRCAKSLRLTNSAFNSPQAEEASKGFLPEKSSARAAPTTTTTTPTTPAGCTACFKRRLSVSGGVPHGKAVVLDASDDNTDRAHFLANMANKTSGDKPTCASRILDDIISAHAPSKKTTTKTQNPMKKMLLRTGSCSDTVDSFRAKDHVKRSLVF